MAFKLINTEYAKVNIPKTTELEKKGQNDDDAVEEDQDNLLRFGRRSKT